MILAPQGGGLPFIFPQPSPVPQCLPYGMAGGIGPTCWQALFALIS